MDKQETIIYAYGEFYERLKNNINLEDGFVYVQVIARQKTDGTEYEHFGFTIKDVDLDFSVPITQAHFKWRPRELNGIETNNGWTKIETESDLPRIHDIRMFMPCEHGKARMDYSIDSETIRAGFRAGVITHWRPIIAVPNPLY